MRERLDLLPRHRVDGNDVPLPVEPVDLLDLKLLPAWVKEPADGKIYDRRGEKMGGTRPKSFGRGPSPPGRVKVSRGSQNGRPPGRGRNHGDQRKVFGKSPSRNYCSFLPHSSAFESVVAQIKSASVAYSIFALARLFLEKPRTL
jgi:hypothetical protein